MVGIGHTNLFQGKLSSDSWILIKHQSAQLTASGPDKGIHKLSRWPILFSSRVLPHLRGIRWEDLLPNNTGHGSLVNLVTQSVIIISSLPLLLQPRSLSYNPGPSLPQRSTGEKNGDADVGTVGWCSRWKKYHNMRSIYPPPFPLDPGIWWKA